MITADTAYKLAWFHDAEGYVTSDYGYLEPEAARRAAPTLNLTRFLHGRPPYSHVIAFSGERVSTIQPLEAA